MDRSDTDVRGILKTHQIIVSWSLSLLSTFFFYLKTRHHIVYLGYLDHSDCLLYLDYLGYLGFELCFNHWSWQIVWPNANQQLFKFTSSSCSLKYCMSNPSYQYWADWLLCQLVKLAPFCTLSTRRQYLSRSSLWFEAQWCWLQSMLVCQQFCLEVGNQ